MHRDDSSQDSGASDASARQKSPARTFLIAVLYGVALMTALSNTALFAAGVAAGSVQPTTISFGLLGWMMVLYIHRRNGWPPFRR
jgi:hypothetical protein